MTLPSTLKVRICEDISVEEMGLHLALTRRGTDGPAILNPTAAAVVALSDGTRTIDEVVESTMEVFQSSDPRAPDRIRALIEELSRSKILDLVADA